MNVLGVLGEEKLPLISSKRRLARRMLYKFSPFKWKEESPQKNRDSVSIPKGRSGHRIIFFNGSIYAFGGFNPNLDEDEQMSVDPDWALSNPLFRELWKFNTNSKKWTRIRMSGVIPRQLASHTATLVQEPGQNPKLLIYGGTGLPYGGVTSNDVFLLDLKTHRWETLMPTTSTGNGFSATDNLPKALYGQAVVFDTETYNFYTVGGTSGYNYFMDVHKLNLLSRTWECLFQWSEEDHFDDQGNEPSPRYRHELAFYKKKLYVFGGGTSAHAEGFMFVHVFDVQNKSWQLRKTKPDPTIPLKNSIVDQFPSPRRCHGLTQLQNLVFIFGGYDGDSIADGTWRINLDTLEWRRLPYELQEPVYFNAAAISQSGKIFSFGGVASIENNTRSNRIYSCWAIVPTLRDMCWEALNHYNNNLDKKSVEELATEGIPRDLIDTLDIKKPDSVG